ncbi:hypothetical protein GGF46_003744 [Coemansia sp. RSA 552]|nr:hypothetical protein GGF46_003744 [Coemansia sp. RSA 552]
MAAEITTQDMAATEHGGQVSELLAVGRQISSLFASDSISPLFVAHFTQKAKARNAAQQEARREWPEPVQRVIAGLQRLGLEDESQIYHVASAYYNWPLYERALCTGAPSPAHLCKLVVMENKRWRPYPAPAAHCNSQFYCVLVQYVHSVDAGKMTDFVRALDNGAVSRKHYNFRLTDADTSLKLTGFGKNGISPIGMLATDLPIIMSAAITRLNPPVFWLGAGHVDFKLALPVQRFIDASGCMVAEISVPDDN